MPIGHGHNKSVKKKRNSNYSFVWNIRLLFICLCSYEYLNEIYDQNRRKLCRLFGISFYRSHMRRIIKEVIKWHSMKYRM